MKKKIPSLARLLLLLLALPLFVYGVQRAQIWWQEASVKPADIYVDTTAILGPMPQPWRALAQGGEEKERMLSGVVAETKALHPRYIRLDHVFDFYEVVSGTKDGGMTYDFQKLDAIIDDLLKTGATPLISLSYMPSFLSRDGKITSPPANWDDWAKIVQRTIEHYSGKNEKNLKEVYYEVWNEPDLFGQWKIGKDPDYLSLYRASALGAKRAQNTNRFYLGGPATTGLYPNWLKGLFNLNERVDFISWHRYEKNPENFGKDIEVLESFLEKNPNFFGIKRLITEWGSNPENSPDHDTNFDAAHTLASIRKFLNRIDLAFSFEIKDGPPPTGEKYWGRWGLLTHDSLGSEKKPRYLALLLLSGLGEERLSLKGEGTRVSGFAAKKGEKIQVILVNFDQEEKHTETVPVTFQNLSRPRYRYTETDLQGRNLTTNENITGNTLEKKVFLPVNSVVLLELEPLN